ncbi:MAG: hypothetical protein L6Q59_09455 [Ignavibacteriaceae bacterium]|nr:hypothetical protein [Ignavibacteriaceae bacterium]
MKRTTKDILKNFSGSSMILWGVYMLAESELISIIFTELLILAVLMILFSFLLSSFLSEG